MKFLFIPMVLFFVFPVHSACRSGGGSPIESVGFETDGSLWIKQGQGYDFVQEDDGFLILGMVASYCYQTKGDPTFDLTDEQRECADKRQSKIKRPDRKLSLFKLDEEQMTGSEYDNAWKKIKKRKCGGVKLDLRAMWPETVRAFDDKPLKCHSDEVRQVVKKATAMAEKFLSPWVEENLMHVPKIERDEILDKINGEREILADFRRMFLERPVVSNKDFVNWTPKFEPILDAHSYVEASNPDKEKRMGDAEKSSLRDLLPKFGAGKPWVTSSGGIGRCGGKTIYTPDILKLAEALTDTTLTNGSQQSGGSAR